MTSSRPLARAQGLEIEVIGDELLVYDKTRDTAHSLNRTAATVWQSCDGHRSVDDLVEALRVELGDIADEDLVRVTLDDLTAGGLLEEAEERDPEAARLNRRRFIRRVGTVSAAALVLPIVHSITAPEPAAAGTVSGDFTQTSPTTVSDFARPRHGGG